MTALMTAAEKGHTRIAQVLLENGADVEAKGPGSLTPLIYAATEGRTETVKLLVDKGADIHRRTVMGTPLEAAQMSGKNDETVKFLRERLGVAGTQPGRSYGRPPARTAAVSKTPKSEEELTRELKGFRSSRSRCCRQNSLGTRRTSKAESGSWDISGKRYKRQEQIDLA
jgi:hypothetical protein